MSPNAGERSLRHRTYWNDAVEEWHATGTGYRHWPDGGAIEFGEFTTADRLRPLIAVCSACGTTWRRREPRQAWKRQAEETPMTMIRSLTLADSSLRPAMNGHTPPHMTQLTSEELRAHKAYYGQNATYAGVASQLGISENSVRQLVRSAEAKLALTGEREPAPAPAPDVPEEREATMPPVKEATSKQAREWTPEEDARLLELRERLTQREIGEKLGRTTATVGWRIGILRRRGELPAAVPVRPSLPAAAEASVEQPAASPEAPIDRPNDPPHPAAKVLASPNPTPDPEIAALGAIYPLLAALSVPARRRTLRWLTERLTEPEVPAPAIADDGPAGRGEA